MSLLVEFGTILIVGLLSVGGFLTTLVSGPSSEDTVVAAASTTTLTEFPGSRQRELIPNILLENAAYQQAAVANSQGLVSAAAVSNPQEALVNIFCTYRTADRIRYTTGSGFFISPTGVILTNAHVAQFLLLEGLNQTGTTECIVRHGNPATPQFEAELLYISPLWIREHATLIADAAPKGTGERDFALLYLTDALGNKPLPATVPYLALDTALQSKNRLETAVTIAGYPTEDTEALIKGTALPLKTATTTIIDLYTFGTNYGDIYFLGGSDVGQQGVSGGPVIDQTGTTIGLVVTRGDDATQGTGSLNAITLSYIDRAISEETGLSLASMMAGNISYRAYLFQQTIVPYLASLLEREL